MSGSESVPSGSRFKRSGGACLSPTYTGDWLFSKSRRLVILSDSIKPWPMTAPDAERLVWAHRDQRRKDLGPWRILPWQKMAKLLEGRAMAAHVVCCVFCVFCALCCV